MNAPVLARTTPSFSMNRMATEGQEAADGDERSLGQHQNARGRVTTGSAGSRGGFSMMSGSTGSTPRARAGRPSVTRLTHRIWMGSSGHGQADERGGEHRQDLAGVAGEQVVDELLDVVVDPPPLLDGRHDGGEVVVGDDHVRDLLGHVGPGDAHGHADVGFLDRRGVVDAVAGHGHDVAPLAPGPDDPQLVLRRDAGVDRDAADVLGRASRRSSRPGPRRSGPGSPPRRSPVPGRWPRPCSCGRP